MQTRKNLQNSEELSILGFGCMRFPEKEGNIDEERAIRMIHYALQQGVNYFDTAYIYQRGQSEIVLGKALADPALRSQARIATKLPPFMVGKLEQAKKIFAKQLERLQTDYIDYYLLHMLTDLAMFKRLESLGVMTWLEELKATGAVRNIGFSFHGPKDDFVRILEAYPWDFCQIQYNYLDENNQAGKSGLMLAAKLNIPVIVMEPLRGGRLVTHLPELVKDTFNAYSDRTPAEWALRWVWNHPEVTLLLSGMSDEAQLYDNIRIASEVQANEMTEAELAVFAKVRQTLLDLTRVPCTACGYCLPCPAGVDIPGCFSCYNDKYLLQDKGARFRYMQTLGFLSVQPANASLCTECGKCESHCPQTIAIRQELKKVRREMEGPFYRPLAAVARKILRVK